MDVNVNVIAKLADLEEVDYQNMIVLHALIDLLIRKGLLTQDELLAEARKLDSRLNHQVTGLNPLASAATTTPPVS